MAAKKRYLMNKAKRQHALNGLQASIPFLWDGINPIENTSQRKAICVALNLALTKDACTYQDYDAAIELIDRSLGGYVYYTSWMAGKGIRAPQGVDPTYFEQQQRHRWVRVLIKALERSLQ